MMCAQVCGQCVGQPEGTHPNLILVRAHRDTLSCSGEEGGHVDEDHSQRGKLRVGKRRLESSRGQSAPVGKQDKKRGWVQGGQHAYHPPPGDTEVLGKVLPMVHPITRVLPHSWEHLKAKAEARSRISLLIPGQRV